MFFFFFSSRRRHTRWTGDWSSDVCSSDLRTGTALEVNGSPHRLDLSDEHARLAARCGVLLAFGSDSHGPGHLANMRFAVATAQRGWVGPQQVLNTLPEAALRRFLAKGRPGR